MYLVESRDRPHILMGRSIVCIVLQLSILSASGGEDGEEEEEEEDGESGSEDEGEGGYFLRKRRPVIYQYQPVIQVKLVPCTFTHTLALKEETCGYKFKFVCYHFIFTSNFPGG